MYTVWYCNPHPSQLAESSETKWCKTGTIQVIGTEFSDPVTLLWYVIHISMIFQHIFLWFSNMYFSAPKTVKQGAHYRGRVWALSGWDWTREASHCDRISATSTCQCRSREACSSTVARIGLLNCSDKVQFRAHFRKEPLLSSTFELETF